MAKKKQKLYTQNLEANERINAKVMTPKQYAKMMGWSLQNVTKHLRAGNHLSGVKEVKKVSRFYILEMYE